MNEPKDSRIISPHGVQSFDTRQETVTIGGKKFAIFVNPGNARDFRTGEELHLLIMDHERMIYALAREVLQLRKRLGS